MIAWSRRVTLRTGRRQCVRCPAMHSGPGQCCRACVVEASSQTGERRDERLEEGRCSCGRVAVEGGRGCERCRAAWRLLQRLRAVRASEDKASKERMRR